MPTQINSRSVLSLRAADTFSTNFQQIFAACCVLLTKICILLFFRKSASKSLQLLITTIHHFTNQFQREFDSNVAIRTQELFSYSRLFAKLTNLFKPFLCVLCASVVNLLLPFAFAEMLRAEMLTCSIQTEFKGNFCLMMLYNHKTDFRTQAIRANSQTFSNRGVLSLRAADKRRAVTSRRRQEACCHFAPPTAFAPSIAKRGDLLSLRAVKKEGLGMGDIFYRSYPVPAKSISIQLVTRATIETLWRK
jgi:hypothetical protein